MRVGAWVVVVGAAGAVVLAMGVPAGGQQPVDRTTTSIAETSTSGPIVTVLPTTTETVPPTSTSFETTTTARRSTTTMAQGSVQTLPRTTTTTTLELVEPPGSVLLPSTTSLPPAEHTRESGLSPGTIVMLVIAGLLLVAIALAVVTWRYWRATTPSVVPSVEPSAGDTVEVSG